MSNEIKPTSKSLKPWEIESVLDSRKLKAQLEATALTNLHDPQEMRKRTLDLVHGALFRGRMIAQERLESGANGLETARLLSEVQNIVVRTLYEFVSTSVFSDLTPADDEKLVLMAVGGYGRNVLAPSSDIDLLFLRNSKETPWASAVVEYVLYMLWDMGLKVGHAFRTIDECIKIGKEDLNTQTALLDARYLCGDKDFGQQFKDRFQHDIVKGNEVKFIHDKLEERDRRHAKQGDNRYVVEPNVKEGKGALRDLQTLYWLVKYSYGGWYLEDILSESKVFTVEEGKIFQRAGEFLWTVRCHLHYITGRAEDRLSFDLQPEIAKRMGFEDEGNRLGVERFMKRYFLEAKAVGSLTRILCAKLEATQQKSKSSLMDFFQLDFSNKVLHNGFEMQSGRLSISDEGFFEEHPIEMLRLFDLAQENKADIHPVALSAVTRSLSAFKDRHRTSQDAIDIFLKLLTETEKPGPSLRLMNESDLLGRMVPEFGDIVAQTQFNMYHHYTVDEHTIKAVEAIAEIERGDAEWFPFGSQVFGRIQNKRALYLAMLLHDTGKGLGDQQVEGAITSMRASKRLGIGDKEAELIAWLVRNHLEMSDCAQKRDLSDPRTISQFVDRVKTLERLNLLLVLTAADIKAVGPGIWNGWKGQLLRELYESSAAALKQDRRDEGDVADDLDLRAEDVKFTLSKRRDDIPALLLEMDNHYWSSQQENELEWHIEALSNAASETVIATRLRGATESVELLVATKDRAGLFADIVGSISHEGATIASAQIHTTSNGGVLDLFILKDDEGRMFGQGDENRLERLKDNLTEAIQNELDPSKQSDRMRPGRSAVFVVDPDIIFDNSGSADFTLLEITGKERIGLLYDIAVLLADAGIRIQSAHVGCYGERIHDVFYVQDADGNKLVDPELTEKLASDMLDILTRNEGSGPRTPAKALSTARSAESF